MRDLLTWPARRWLAAAGGASLLALLIGVPTAVVPNPWFVRMTELDWWSWPVWTATAVLGGLVLATYVRSPAGADRDGGMRAGGGGLLGFLAVGCPTCNSVVVAVLGTAGAMQWWAPVQPVLGVASLGLLGWALRARLRAERACPVPDAAELR